MPTHRSRHSRRSPASRLALRTLGLGSLALAMALVPLVSQSVGSHAPSTASAATTLQAPAQSHFTVNLSGSYSAARSLGYNVFDVAGSTTNPTGVRTKLAALPAGSKAMIWVGNLDNSSSTPGFTLAQFKAQVDALRADSRVYGYFISDEAHPNKFPLAATHIRERADYIRAVAPTHKAFIVVADGTKNCGGVLGCEYRALRPAVTHVHLMGIVSYPCHLGAACDFSKISQRVNAAYAAGVPKAAMVPVYQTFGQEGKVGAYYRTPTTAELQRILATWSAALPTSVLDYSYTWGQQTSAPQALSNHPTMQAVMKSFQTP